MFITGRNRKVRQEGRQALTWARGTLGWRGKTRERKKKGRRSGEKMEESGLAELTISGGFVRMRGGFASVFMGSDGAL